MSSIYVSFWVTGFWENVDFEVGEVGENYLTEIIPPKIDYEAKLVPCVTFKQIVVLVI